MIRFVQSLLALLALGSWTPAAAQPAPSPNIVLVVADDLGYGDLGCFGQRILRTPQLDRLAQTGVRFTHAYAGSTVCAPSRCVLMTGLHTGHAWIRGNSNQNLRPEDVTVAEVLAAAGYRTGCFGKWGLGHEGSVGVPNAQGFQEFFGYLNQLHAHNSFPTFLLRNQERVPLRNVVPAEGAHGQGRATVAVDYAHDLITTEALRFVADPDPRPFFCYVPWNIPHANNEAGAAGMEVPDLGPFAASPWPPPAQGFAAMMAQIDRDVGRLVLAASQRPGDRDTLVLFTSDNGPHREGGNDPEFFGSRGGLRGIKRSLHDGGIRVPLIAHWIRNPTGPHTVERPVGFQDVLATLADVARIPSDQRPVTDGWSFEPALRGADLDAPDPSRTLYWAFYEGQGGQALRQGPWKAVQQPYHTPVRIYDLVRDPGETTDLSAQRPDLVAALSAAMSEAYEPSERWRFPTDGK